MEEVEQAFEKLVQYFGNRWLNSEAGTHTLQQLWRRRDAIATNELFTFGSSVLAAEQASAEWLKAKIKLVLKGDENNQRGAIFEILAVGYTASRQKVTPARANQPGFDIDIATKEGALYRVSLKRYSQSVHEKLFRKKSGAAEAKFLAGMSKTRFNAQMYVEANEYPAESDWQRLYTKISQLTSEFCGHRVIDHSDGKWLIAMLPLLPDQHELLSSTHVSYSFVCTSCHHKNEQSNFLSKLDSAISNLERHVAPNSDQLPVILMQLPITASAHTLKLWSDEYLRTNPSSTVEAIFFLQSYTSSSEDMSSSHISHFVSAAVSESFQTRAARRLEFEVPVGIITRQPPEWRLHSDAGRRSLPEQYVYQRGKHYIAATTENSGKLRCDIKRKAPGIESIAVFNLNGENVVFAGRWGEDLCLIG